jgi:hypothetical protein
MFEFIKKLKNEFHEYCCSGIAKKETEPIDEEQFTIGSIWIFEEANPFQRFKTEIKDVREGHVLYRHCISTSIFQNESCSMERFLYMYKKEKK